MVVSVEQRCHGCGCDICPSPQSTQPLLLKGRRLEWLLYRNGSTSRDCPGLPYSSTVLWVTHCPWSQSRERQARKVRKGAPTTHITTIIPAHQNKNLKQLLESTLNDPFIETTAKQSLYNDCWTPNKHSPINCPLCTLLLPPAKFEVSFPLDSFLPRCKRTKSCSQSFWTVLLAHSR